MPSLAKIQEFVAQHHIAIAGISRTPQKFGNTVFKELKLQGYSLYPISKHMLDFEGIACFQDVASLPTEVTAIILITKPEHTKTLLKEAKDKGIQHVWLQQGSTDAAIMEYILNEGITAITGECILMYASPTHFIHKTHRFLKKMIGSYPR